MRDLIFKNLTSTDRSRRVICSSETLDKQGMRTIIRKHFVYKVMEIDDAPKQKPIPQVFVFRVCNHLKQQERFFCRMKASLYAKSKGRIFLILFGHSLKIDSRPII